jgi:hypothetical protein
LFCVASPTKNRAEIFILQPESSRSRPPSGRWLAYVSEAMVERGASF